LLLALAFLLLFRLGDRGLNEPDEGRYANISLEMSEAGHSAWEPMMSDFGHYDKPPLTYWLTALAFRLLGLSETAARLVPLFGAALALIGVGWTAYRLYGPSTAWWTVLMCGTLGQFWLLARFLSPDMLLTGWTTLALAAWVEARHRHGSWIWWSLSLLAWTAAWWTKATAALIPLLGLAVGLWVRRDWAGLRALRPGWMLLGILVLGSPWYLDLMRVHPELQDFFLGREIVGRIAGHPDGRKAPIYFHLLLTLGAWLPWWPVLLVALFRRWRQAAAPRRVGWREWPLELWIVLSGLIVFTCVSSKLPTYTLPYAPWAALFCARAWQGLALEGWFSRQPKARISAALAFAALYVGVTFVEPLIESRLGRNSSVRELGAFLRREKADLVFCDRYWPGLEFYFGERVHYLVPRAPQQLRGDSGYCVALGGPHFLSPTNWLTTLSRHPSPVWLVSLRDNPQSPLWNALGQGTLTATNRLGDFTIVRFEQAAVVGVRH
jgi:4-amino-4-deoxy-L-arabinose transferase-like glycosyltransferase